ncbi:hypothetical protein PM082_016889 [Marasmius tenuissimus]|nr:hypothetical protein PM082_016889 [Marasmius tenuissimus]
MKAVSSLTELESLLKNSSAMESEEMKELVKGLRVAVEDEEQRREILEKKGEDAQHWLDVLQLLADSPDTSSLLRSTILTIMVRLSKNSGHFPKCLVIKNVKKQGEHPVGGGGFGDVWKGTVDHAGSTQTVCLKVVKVYLTSDVRQSLAVCSVLSFGGNGWLKRYRNTFEKRLYGSNSIIQISYHSLASTTWMIHDREYV